MKCTIASFCFLWCCNCLVQLLALRSAGRDYTNNCGSRDWVINICGCVCIPGAKQGMLELIPQTLFFQERARQYGGRVWVPETRTWQLQKMIEKVKVPAFSDQVKGNLARSSGALVSLSPRKPWKAMRFLYSTTSTAELLDHWNKSLWIDKNILITTILLALY